MYRRILLIVLVCCCFKLNAQHITKTVSLANFKTISGKEIKNCVLGYTTMGNLNADKSNVVLWPTWFVAKSAELCKDIIPLLIDTTGLYIIVVDAFGNGLSSSPSNNSSFPEIMIRDMVNSQYELLTKYLHINHLKLLIGGSMGGMQVLEWIIAYPGFTDNAISIAGSPKLSSYDLMFWKNEASPFNMLVKDSKANEFALRVATNSFLQNLYTPSYWLHSIKPEKVDSVIFLHQTDILKKMKPEDWICQVKVILTQDIYKSSEKTIADMKQQITAKTLIVVTKSDHIVNQQSSIDLAKAIGATLLELDNDCGHAGFMCDQKLIKETITKFLE